MPIRPDGTVALEIDTALAKASHPDHDHRYEITAEITDQSRRTIVGTGTVLVARKPFSVYTWVDRGHYRAGETIEAGISAQTLDRKPVAGKGTLKLLKIAYDAERNPVETPVESWDLALGTEGEARQELKATAPGQYRLSATIDDGQGHQIEGGYLLTITGQGFDGASFRYNDLEIIPEKQGVPSRRDLATADQHATRSIRPSCSSCVRRAVSTSRPRSSSFEARAPSKRSASSLATCPTCSSRP